MVADKIPVDTQGYMPTSIPTRVKKKSHYLYRNESDANQTCANQQLLEVRDVFEKILEEVEGSF